MDILKELVIETAKNFWEENPEDFCIQFDSFDSIVFGCTNRIIWSIYSGYRLSEMHCTDKFIKHFNETF